MGMAGFCLPTAVLLQGHIPRDGTRLPRKNRGRGVMGSWELAARAGHKSEFLLNSQQKGGLARNKPKLGRPSYP